MVGIFDSGSGGLTVLKALRTIAPRIDVVYFGDLVNMPYGQKTQDELIVLTREAIKKLRVSGATYIVSACNSVSAQVIRTHKIEDDVIEMVAPTVKEVSNSYQNGVIVLATPATTSSGMYQSAFLNAGVEAHVIDIAGLADAIEFGDDVRVDELIRVVIQKMIAHNPRVVVLACTHYPLVINRFRELFGMFGLDSVDIFDPGMAVAREIVEKYGANGSGKIEITTSAPSSVFDERARMI